MLVSLLCLHEGESNRAVAVTAMSSAIHLQLWETRRFGPTLDPWTVMDNPRYSNGRALVTFEGVARIPAPCLCWPRHSSRATSCVTGKATSFGSTIPI